MSRDTGIRNLLPGYRDPKEIKEDENTRKYIETIVNRRAKVTPWGWTPWRNFSKNYPKFKSYECTQWGNQWRREGRNYLLLGRT